MKLTSLVFLPALLPASVLGKRNTNPTFQF